MDTGSIDDKAWAEGVLLRWLSLVTAARRVAIVNIHGLFVFTDKPEAAGLAAVEDQTRAVVRRVTGRASVLLNPATTSAAYEIGIGEAAVRFALGRLRTQQETQARVGSSAPTMAADALHHLIWQAASSLWDSGHFGQAVQKAATELNAHVRDRVDRHDVSDSVLMTQVFRDEDPQSGSPRLRWPGAPNDQTVKSMRRGLQMVPAGLFLSVRNVVTHATEEVTRQDALEALASLSMVARWIDKCDVLKAP